MPRRRVNTCATGGYRKSLGAGINGWLAMVQGRVVLNKERMFPRSSRGLDACTWRGLGDGYQGSVLQRALAAGDGRGAENLGVQLAKCLATAAVLLIF